ncbi:farnesyl-diphosphate farnesyltransferase [Cryphonectria parasitica EP155]|uniref:Squalene synthase n=1 Tax=Cryphonectria parasitica (strain ATCC 38755 / EP155) TaxID=660469 RepID=A0A9P4XVN5_CRYP1|nr:farnesyl-diphosphate farnesyltransferase [Cryphonectria parasitica EP155]KAF3762142.1 farnesyl-diphosphate farnesyltransferase [Cryphonectria parasitica EP155]
MGAASQALYYVFHPNQLRSIIQWKIWHDPVHRREPSKETPTVRSCFHYLDLTSRSFSAVIQELNPELLMPIALFYLVLRGLDTIEDDMTLDIKVKEPLLRDFHNSIEVDGWTFTQSGPNEKDRELLVHFDDIIFELRRVKKEYFVIIKDITDKMGNGMADYALNSDLNEYGVISTKDYELYCHYVAGLVGEGLTRLFVESKLANPALLERPQLAEAMGQFLQKVNIIRDIKEDWDEGKKWWPKEIWSKHVDNMGDLLKPEHRQNALWCSSEMVLNALKHAEECLYYMAAVRDQSVFNFVAIPQSMAIATLDLVFMNPAIFERNVKITKGDACQLMIESTQDLKLVYEFFRRYARRIHRKADPRDPSYLAICIQCGKIEQFIERIFPTQDVAKLSDEEKAKAKQRELDKSTDQKEAMYLILAVVLVLVLVGSLMVGLAWFMGAKFTEAIDKVPTTTITTSLPTGHEEL